MPPVLKKTYYTNYQELGRVEHVSWGRKIHSKLGLMYYVKADSEITESAKPLEATFKSRGAAEICYDFHVLTRYGPL